MKVAVIQLCRVDNQKKNLEKAFLWAEKAIQKNAKFIVFPEAFLEKQLDRDKEFFSLAVDKFRSLAKEKKVFILLGSVYEYIKGKKKAYNTSIFLGHDGKIRAKYRKIHLFKASIDNKVIKEEKKFLSGDNLVTASAENYKIGLSICYDLRFSKMYWEYRKKGVNVFCVPSAFIKKTGQVHWEILVRARAIENLCYVLAPNLAGTNSQGVMLYGNSMIVDPWGKIVARASTNKEEIIYADLNIKDIQKVRKILPEFK